MGTHPCTDIARFNGSDEAEQPWFELQVRTLAQHVWAEVEHILGYKPDVHVPSYVRRQLGLLSKWQSIFDDEFELIRDELDGHAQRSDQISDDTYITPPVLSALLQEAGLKVPRDWVTQTLKLLHSRGVDVAGRFRRLVQIDAIRPLMTQVFMSKLDRPPRDMEFISTLANLADLLDGAETLEPTQLQHRIEAQIDFDREWQEVLQKSRGR